MTGVRLGRSIVVALGALAGCSSLLDIHDPIVENASTDSGPRGDGSAGDGGPFCESLVPKPTFCADFDDGKPADEGFVFRGKRDAGNYRLDPAVFISPPSALEVTHLGQLNERSPGKWSAEFGLDRDAIGAITTRALAAVDLRVDSFDPTAPARLLILEIASTEGRYFLMLRASQPSADVVLQFYPAGSDTAQTSIASLSRGLTVGNWTRVEMVVTREPAELIVRFDGVDAMLPKALNAAWVAGTVGIDLSCDYYADTSTVAPTTIHYDNLVVDVK